METGGKEGEEILTELAEKGYTEYAKEEQLKEIQEKVKKAVQMYESN
jgi:hypothetical protein